MANMTGKLRSMWDWYVGLVPLTKHAVNMLLTIAVVYSALFFVPPLFVMYTIKFVLSVLLLASIMWALYCGTGNINTKFKRVYYFLYAVTGSEHYLKLGDFNVGTKQPAAEE